MVILFHKTTEHSKLNNCLKRLELFPSPCEYMDQQKTGSHTSFKTATVLTAVDSALVYRNNHIKLFRSLKKTKKNLAPTKKIGHMSYDVFESGVIAPQSYINYIHALVRYMNNVLRLNINFLISTFQYLTSLEQRLQQCRDENERLIRENETLKQQLQFLQKEVRFLHLI